jgi:G3E family GTPase
VEATVVVADAEAIRSQAVHPHRGRRLRRQLLAADLIVLNKAELLGHRERTSICDWLAGFIPRPRVVETTFGRVPVSLIVDRSSEATAAGREAGHQPTRADHDFDLWSWARPTPLDPGAFRWWAASLPEGVLRGTGVVHFASEPDQRQRFQLVGSRWSVARSGSWAGESRHSALALIGHAGTFDPRLLDMGIASCVVESGAGEPEPYAELAATS